VTDVMEQGSQANNAPILSLVTREFGQRSARFKSIDGPSRQMVDAEGVEETGVKGTGVYEVGKPELLDVSKALELGRIHDGGSLAAEADVLPQRIPDGPNDLPGIACHWATLRYDQPNVQ
jgi:hypothetical protein